MKRAYRISDPFTAPAITATPIIRTIPISTVGRARPSFTKNEATTTRKPASGPTDRSMPPVIREMFCPRVMKPSAVAAVSRVATLKFERYSELRVIRKAESSTMIAATSADGA